MATEEQLDFIDKRDNHLVGVSKDAVESALKYIFLTNAGGAVATLSFLGAVFVKRLPLKFALGLFVAGLILVGVHAALWIHFSKLAFDPLAQRCRTVLPNSDYLGGYDGRRQ
jgi:uncharacterized membrane protein